MKLQLVPPDGADELCGANQQQNNFEVGANVTIEGDDHAFGTYVNLEGSNNVNQIERSLSTMNYN